MKWISNFDVWLFKFSFSIGSAKVGMSYLYANTYVFLSIFHLELNVWVLPLLLGR